MGKAHAAAAAGIATAQADEQLREAEARRNSAERERQLLTSYLGSQSQVQGTGSFANVDPNVLKYTQRYSVDQRALQEILTSGSQVKRQEDPFQGADNRVRGGLSLQDYSQGYATRANDLLAQAEAAARAGDFTGADQLYSQAQAVIGGISQVAQGSYNLGGGEESAAAIRASSAEGRIVGRQLLAAQELQDPNSATSTGLRGRLLDPSLSIIEQSAQSALGEIESGEQGALASINQGTLDSVGQIDASEREAQTAIDENIRNAERAIASERSEIDGQIRQRGAGGGVGVNARSQIALQSQAASQASRQRAGVYSTAASQAAQVRSEAGRIRASIYDDDAAQRASIQTDAALQRAQVFTMQGAQRAQLTAEVSLYMNEFTKRMAEDSVALAQQWVDGTAGVRDEFQAALDRFSIIGIEMANQRAVIAQQTAENRRREAKQAKAVRNESLLGFATGLLPLATVLGGKDPTSGSTSGQSASSGSVTAGSSGLGEEAEAVVGSGAGSSVGASKSGGGGGLGGGLGSLVASFFL